MTLRARARLVPVVRADLDALFELKVRPDQANLLAPNEISLAELAFQPAGSAFTVRAGDALVGFCQVMDLRHVDWDEEDRDALYLWRFMIGADHQGKGYGTAALDGVIALARELGRARVLVSTADWDGSALPFYERNGFARTGRVINDEVEMVREL